MPNHFHGILEITKNDDKNTNVGADLCVCPDDVDKQLGGTYRFTSTGGKFQYNKKSVSSIIQWFKIMITNAYIKLVY